MPATKETKTGIVDLYYDNDSGVIKEDGSGNNYDFYHPGAKVEFGEKGGVTYLKITTPTGKVIINEVGKKH